MPLQIFRLDHILDNEVVLEPLDCRGLPLRLPLVAIGHLIAILDLSVSWFLHWFLSCLDRDYPLLLANPATLAILAPLMRLDRLGWVDYLYVLVRWTDHGYLIPEEALTALPLWWVLWSMSSWALVYFLITLVITRFQLRLRPIKLVILTWFYGDPVKHVVKALLVIIVARGLRSWVRQLVKVWSLWILSLSPKSFGEC